MDITFGYWNVLTLNRPGALESLLDVMDRFGVDIIALQEINWTGQGLIKTNNHTVYYSCDDTETALGTGFVVVGRFRRKVWDFKPISPRICYIRIKDRLFYYSLISCHAPPEASDDNEKKEFYDSLENTIKLSPANDIKIICGDFGAEIGKETTLDNFDAKITTEPSHSNFDAETSSRNFDTETAHSNFDAEVVTETTLGNFDVEVGEETAHSNFDAEVVTETIHGNFFAEVGGETAHSNFDAEVVTETTHGNFDVEVGEETAHSNFDAEVALETTHDNFDREGSKETSSSNFDSEIVSGIAHINFDAEEGTETSLNNCDAEVPTETTHGGDDDLDDKEGTETSHCNFDSEIGIEIVRKPVIGKHSLHDLNNDNGCRLIDFCTSQNLIIASTCFPHKNIHKVTWYSPDGITVKQVDHLLVSAEHRSVVLDVRSFRGASFASDHYLSVAKLRTMLLVCKNKRGINIMKEDSAKLKDTSES